MGDRLQMAFDGVCTVGNFYMTMCSCMQSSRGPEARAVNRPAVCRMITHAHMTPMRRERGDKASDWIRLTVGDNPTAAAEPR